jgi:hypothetical protein
MNKPSRLSSYTLLIAFLLLIIALPAVTTIKANKSYPDYPLDSLASSPFPLQNNPCPPINFNSPINIKGGDSVETIVVGDFNEDKHIDIAIRVFKLPGVFNIDVFLGDGKGNFSFAKNIPVMNNPNTLFAGDFNRDGHLDLGTATDHNIFVFTGDGLGNFQPVVSFTGSVGNGSTTGGISRGLADLNKDGNLDLVIGGTTKVFLGNGLGQFIPKDSLMAGSDRPVGIGDFNKDNNLDLITGGLFLGDGLGNFSLFNPGVNSGAVGDFNKDGNLDLVNGIGDLDLTISLGDGTGRFRESQILNTEKRLIRDVLVEDLNKDNNLDLIVLNAGGGVVLLGDGQGKFCNGITFPGKELAAKACAIGDFNEDGRPDLAVADFMLGSFSILLNKAVEPPPPPPQMDFSISFNPSTINLARGQSSVFTVNINRTGNFVGNVTVIAPDTKPIKTKLTPSAQSTTGTSLNFSLKIKKAAPIGNKQLTFTGRDDTGRVRTSTLTLTIR